MPEESCPDPPRKGKGGCRFDPASILTDPARLEPPVEALTIVLRRRPEPEVQAWLGLVRQVELSWRAPWEEIELIRPWTLLLEDLAVGQEDDLFELEILIRRARERGATHLLASLSWQDTEPCEEYQHRLLGLIRNLCDQAGLTFAAQIPGAKVNQYLASANCCRWPKKG